MMDKQKIKTLEIDLKLQTAVALRDGLLSLYYLYLQTVLCAFFFFLKSKLSCVVHSLKADVENFYRT